MEDDAQTTLKYKNPVKFPKLTPNHAFAILVMAVTKIVTTRKRKLMIVLSTILVLAKTKIVREEVELVWMW
jgi:hypothetical protein